MKIRTHVFSVKARWLSEVLRLKSVTCTCARPGKSFMLAMWEQPRSLDAWATVSAIVMLPAEHVEQEASSSC